MSKKKTTIHYKNDLAVLSPSHGGITILNKNLFLSPMMALHYYLTKDKELREKLLGSSSRSSSIHLVRKNEEAFDYTNPKLKRILHAAYSSYLEHPYLLETLLSTTGDLVYSEDWVRDKPSILGVNSIGEGQNLVGKVLTSIRNKKSK